MITDLLLDIEGTTRPTSFVNNVLFPYARKLPTLIKHTKFGCECEETIQGIWQEWRLTTIR